MSFTAFVACGLVICVLTVTVKQYRPEIASEMSIAGGILLFSVLLAWLVPLLDDLTEIVSSLDSFSHLSVIIKAIGICLVAQIASDTCKDAGQQSLAAKIDIGGKIAVLAVSFPLFKTLLELAAEIIEI
ncbi:MAG: stage III sporulation AC/AD family protein [Oscillospiraceae bacterium]|jgi:stage III sporulation protein AD|nr:stage III sporulation AC/AD family protein [Oscillospiraceae bacterium]